MSGPIRSDPSTVNRLLADLDAREAERAKRLPPPMGARQYRNGPDANPDWPCQGGLPSLGEDY